MVCFLAAAFFSVLLEVGVRDPARRNPPDPKPLYNARLYEAVGLSERIQFRNGS